MQNSLRNWDSTGIGIVAFATALAVATAAGIFAVKEFEEGIPWITTILAMLLATISLVSYLLVVLFSVATLLRESQNEQREQIVKAAFSVFAQAYAAVFAAGVIIYFPLLEGIAQ